MTRSLIVLALSLLAFDIFLNDVGWNRGSDDGYGGILVYAHDPVTGERLYITEYGELSSSGINFVLRHNLNGSYSIGAKNESLSVMFLEPNASCQQSAKCMQRQCRKEVNTVELQDFCKQAFNNKSNYLMSSKNDMSNYDSVTEFYVESLIKTRTLFINTTRRWKKTIDVFERGTLDNGTPLDRQTGKSLILLLRQTVLLVEKLENDRAKNIKKWRDHLQNSDRMTIALAPNNVLHRFHLPDAQLIAFLKRTSIIGPGQTQITMSGDVTVLLDLLMKYIETLPKISHNSPSIRVRTNIGTTDKTPMTTLPDTTPMMPPSTTLIDTDTTSDPAIPTTTLINANTIPNMIIPTTDAADTTTPIASTTIVSNSSPRPKPTSAITTEATTSKDSIIYTTIVPKQRQRRPHQQHNIHVPLPPSQQIASKITNTSVTVPIPSSTTTTTTASSTVMRKQKQLPTLPAVVLTTIPTPTIPSTTATMTIATTSTTTSTTTTAKPQHHKRRRPILSNHNHLSHPRLHTNSANKQPKEKTTTTTTTIAPVITQQQQPSVVNEQQPQQTTSNPLKNITVTTANNNTTTTTTTTTVAPTTVKSKKTKKVKQPHETNKTTTDNFSNTTTMTNLNAISNILDKIAWSILGFLASIKLIIAYCYRHTLKKFWRHCWRSWVCCYRCRCSKRRERAQKVRQNIKKHYIPNVQIESHEMESLYGTTGKEGYHL